MDLGAVARAFPQLLGGLPETLTLVSVALACGFFLALATALGRLSANPFARGAAWTYVYLFRSTPLLVQIFLIYYGSGQFRPFLQDVGVWFLFRDAWFCALLALSLNSGAYAAEIIRGGLESVERGQIEAARAVGMSPWQVFKRVTFFQAARQALPAYGNEVILMVKATSLASTITILEITGIARKIIASTFQPIEVFVAAGAIYLTLNFLVVQGVRLAERGLNPQDRKPKAPKLRGEQPLELASKMIKPRA